MQFDLKICTTRYEWAWTHFCIANEAIIEHVLPVLHEIRPRWERFANFTPGNIALHWHMPYSLHFYISLFVWGFKQILPSTSVVNYNVYLLVITEWFLTNSNHFELSVPSCTHVCLKPICRHLFPLWKMCWTVSWKRWVTDPNKINNWAHVLKCEMHLV